MDKVDIQVAPDNKELDKQNIAKEQHQQVLHIGQEVRLVLVLGIVVDLDQPQFAAGYQDFDLADVYVVVVYFDFVEIYFDLKLVY